MNAASNLFIGQEWDSIAEAKQTVRQWLREQGLSFKTLQDGPKRWILTCKEQYTSGCTFRIRVNKGNIKGQTWAKLSILHPHTCSSSTHYDSKASRSAKSVGLDLYYKAILLDDPNLKPSRIRSEERLRFGNDIPYYTAWRALQLLKANIWGDEAASFEKIPALLEAFKKEEAEKALREGRVRRPSCQVCLEKDEDLTRFKRCWVLPGATQAASRHLRPLIGADGTHTKARHRLVLLLVVGIDGNSNNLPIAWALVPIENGEHWRWFLEGIAPFLPFLGNRDAVIISDRQKGLIKAVEKAFPQATHANCCQHIAENIRAKWGTKSGLVKLFWRTARAKTEAEFLDALGKIKETNVPCFTFLSRIPANTWSFYAFPRPRYGHDTSNFVESMNRHWEKERHLPATRLLTSIWQWMMNYFYQRFKAQHKTPRITDEAIAYMDTQLIVPRRYHAFSSAPEEGIVTTSTGSQRRVHLAQRICSCGEFQDRKLPCRHALHLCKEQRLDRESYVNRIYSIAELRATYQCLFPPIILDDLPSDPTCQAPRWIRLPGRPTVARRRTKQEVRELRCSNCHEQGHNKRRCSQARRHLSESGSESESESVFGSETEAEAEEQEEDEENNYIQVRAEVFEAMIEAEREAEAERSVQEDNDSGTTNNQAQTVGLNEEMSDIIVVADLRAIEQATHVEQAEQAEQRD